MCVCVGGGGGGGGGNTWNQRVRSTSKSAVWLLTEEQWLLVMQLKHSPLRLRLMCAGSENHVTTNAGTPRLALRANYGPLRC